MRVGLHNRAGGHMRYSTLKHWAAVTDMDRQTPNLTRAAALPEFRVSEVQSRGSSCRLERLSLKDALLPQRKTERLSTLG